MKKTLILFIGALLLFVFIGFSYTNKVVCREGLTTPVISDPNNYIPKDSHAPGVEEGTAWEWDADVVDGRRDGSGDDHLGTAKGGFVCPAGACYRPGTYNLCAYNDSSSSKCDTGSGYVDGSGQQWGNGWVKNPWYDGDGPPGQDSNLYKSKPNRYWCPSDSCFDISTNVCTVASSVDASGLAICGKDGIVGNGKYYSVKLDHDISESMEILAANWENAGCTTGTAGHLLGKDSAQYSNWWFHQSGAVVANDAFQWCFDSIQPWEGNGITTLGACDDAVSCSFIEASNNHVQGCFGGLEKLNKQIQNSLDKVPVVNNAGGGSWNAGVTLRTILDGGDTPAKKKAAIRDALCSDLAFPTEEWGDTTTMRIDAAKEWFLKKKTTAKKNVEHKKIEDDINKLRELDVTDLKKREIVLDKLERDAAALPGKPTPAPTPAPTPSPTGGPTASPTPAPTPAPTPSPTPSQRRRGRSPPAPRSSQRCAPSRGCDGSGAS